MSEDKENRCLVCKEKCEMLLADLSNDIRVNVSYDMSDDLRYCSHCGALFIENWSLGKYKKENES